MKTETPTPPINIIIADDHPVYLLGFKKLFNKFRGVKVIAEASNGNELIEVAKRLKPDIIITDVKMPGIDGIQATKELVKEIPGVKIIAISMVDELNVITDMLEAGAKGYLLKNASPDEIISAVNTVHQGYTYYCRDCTAQLINLLPKKEEGSSKKTKTPGFSDRELSIIKLLCHGFSNKEIASQIHLSTRTIEWHKKQILEKLDAKNTSSIVAFAVKNKIC